VGNNDARPARRPIARSLDLRRLRSPRAYAAIAQLVTMALLDAMSTIAAGWMAQDPSARNLALLGIGLIGATVCYVTGQVTWSALIDRGEGQLRADLLASALSQPISVLGEQAAGEILDRVDDDARAVGVFFRESVWVAGRLVVSFLPMWVVAGITWWPAAVLFPLLLLATYLAARTDMARLAKVKIEEEKAWTAHAAAFEESVTARDDLRTSLGQPYAIRRLAELSAEIHRRMTSVAKLEFRITLRTGLLVHAFLALIAAAGVFLAVQQRISLAQLVTLFIVTQIVVSAATEFVQYLPGIQEGYGSILRVRQLFDVAPEPVGGEPVPPGEIGLEIRDLNFDYEAPVVEPVETTRSEAPVVEPVETTRSEAAARPTSTFALQHISLSVPPGQTLALVGRTGSGKSTLAALLSRAIEPPRGTMFLGGADVVDLDLQALRSTVGVVTQQTQILAGTLRENLTLFAPVAPGVVEQAIADLGLVDWVAGLPYGLDTLLGPGGTKLSAGEEQLVAFARLLVRDVQVVVLDEATARMDPQTEALVVNAAQRLLANRTGILIAHRLSTIERADLVAVLDHGKLVQFGERAALAAEPGAYQTLLTNAAAETDDAPESTVVTESSDTDLAATRRTVAPPDRRPPRQGISLMRAVVRLFAVHWRWGLLGGVFFTTSSFFAAQGPITGYLWGHTVTAVEQHRPAWLFLVLLTLSLIAQRLLMSYGVRWYPLWWIQNLLRIRLAIMRGQTEQRRLPPTPAGEVVGRAMDADRLVFYADRWIDFVSGFVVAAVTAAFARSWLAGAILLAVMATSAAAATLGRSIAGRSAKAAADARAQFGRALVSGLEAMRTVKLAARTQALQDHLRAVDAPRVRAAVFEHRVRALLGGVAPIMCYVAAFVGWAFFYSGRWSLTTTLLVTSSALGFVYYGIVSGAVVTEFPGARAWQLAANAFADGADLMAVPAGVSLVDGTAPSPMSPTSSSDSEATSTPLLQLHDFTVIHDDDGTIGVADIDLAVRRGELVLLLGRVGSGKSSLLAALAGLMSYDGELLWDGAPVSPDAAELLLRPPRVAYVSQVPHLVSGTIADNVRLDHAERELDGPLRDARLAVDVAEAGGLDAMIGTRGVRLSGGQAQRLALARALACDPQLLVADDISSALDATTELELWDSLRARGTTVLGSTSKVAALAKADRVVVLVGGEIVADGPWTDLSADWSHLAG